jgi:hypothetical protein
VETDAAVHIELDLLENLDCLFDRENLHNVSCFCLYTSSSRNWRSVNQIFDARRVLDQMPNPRMRWQQ